MHAVVLVQSIELKEWPAAIGRGSHVVPPSLVRSSVFGPIAYASFASTQCSDVTLAPAGSVTCVQETPPSGVA
jgi:hypothetical protein